MSVVVGFCSLLCSELFDDKKPTAEELKPAALSISQRELARVVERMGDLLLGVKTLFDCRCEAGEAVIGPEDAAGMLLDLCLSEQAFAAARAALRTAGTQTVDFAGFLEMYSKHCALLGGESGRASSSIWVPDKSGLWSEVMICTSCWDKFTEFRFFRWTTVSWRLCAAHASP